MWKEDLADDENIDPSTIFTGLITHFLAECPSRPLTTPGDALNNGAVCMPYYLFNTADMSQSTLRKESYGTSEFSESVECINSLCQSSSKADWASDTWVWYDTWPLGSTYYPKMGKTWDSSEQDGGKFLLLHYLEQNRLPFLLGPVSHQLPWSGRGVCHSDGTCTWRAGFELPNWEIHCSELGTC